MGKREQYAIGQHDLCCEHLGIGNSHEDHCDTLFEAVLSLKDQIETEKKRADLLQDILKDVIDTVQKYQGSECDLIVCKQKPRNLANQPKKWFEASAAIEGDSSVTTFSDKNHVFRVCDNCGENVEINGFGGVHDGCDYVWGRRGWRQLGVYDG